MLHNIKGFLVGMIVAIIALLSFMYFINKPSETASTQPEPEPAEQPTTPTEVDESSNAESADENFTETLLEGPAVTSFENNVYTNSSYSFRITIPEDWALEKEDVNLGGDNTRASFTAPDFKEELAGSVTNTVFYASVSSRNPEFEREYTSWNLGGMKEESISIAGQDSLLITGKNEFGQDLTIVHMPHGANTIVLMLRTTQEPFASQFQEILNSFEYLS